jgi:GTP cyclohydrolase I
MDGIDRKTADSLKNLFESALKELGLDIWDDKELQKTPERMAKAWVGQLFKGLNLSNFPKITTFENKSTQQNTITVKDIGVYSMCKHHFLPFTGKCTISYVPNSKLLGLSKFAKIVDFYARQPQLQEQLTQVIFEKLNELLQPKKLYVKIECEHMCIKMRVANSENSVFITEYGSLDV